MHNDPANCGRLIFDEARTHNVWTERTVPVALLHDLYERLKWAPTSANSNPGRFTFVCSQEAKERLKPSLGTANVDKVMGAPATVIVAEDTRFFELMPALFPARDMRSMFEEAPALAAETATRNAVLQGAYLILAARSLGLDCGPMSGFDRQAVDREFFPDERWRSHLLVNIGYGDHSRLWPRNPRLSFDQACLIL